MECVFCKIVNQHIPAYRLLENESTLAFLDIHPLAAGHSVVIPKQHTPRMADLSESDAAQVFLTVKRVSDIIHASLKPDGFTIGINDGPGGGQGVPHLHVHIIPRWNGDGGGNLHTIIKQSPTESVDTIFKKLISQ